MPDDIKFYYVESLDDYWLGKRIDNCYYAKWHDTCFVWETSQNLPWGETVENPDTVWKEYTYPSEPKEIPLDQWFRGFLRKYGGKVIQSDTKLGGARA